MTISPLIAWLVLASSLVQEAPKAKAPDAALFDELIRKTNELRAFVAVYRVGVPDQKEKLSLRITFRAPDDLKLEFPGPMLMGIRMGTLDVRGQSPDGKSMTAHVPMSELSEERTRRFAGLVRSEFTDATSDWSTETECGSVLQMKITPSGKADKENFQFMASYACPRTSVLGWLENWRTRTDARIEDGDRLVFTTLQGSEVTLSTLTGFIESIRKGKGESGSMFKLESLDLDPELDSTSFELPEPATSAVDGSAQFVSQWQNTITESQRRKLLKWISRRIADGKLAWDSDTRARLKKLLVAIHSEGFTLENEPWIEGTRKRIEGFGPSLRDRLAKADDQARAQLDGEIDEKRDKLVEILQRMLQQRLSTLSIDASAVVDDALRSDLETLESAAVQTAFDHALQNPLLESFDDQIQRAKRGG